MRDSNILSSFSSLKSYCESEKFLGWDPYDGLNSKIFQALPIKNWSFARMAWIQLFKRSPINLRDLFLVPKGFNSKGLALLLNGYCNLYHIAISGNEEFGSIHDLEKIIIQLADQLITMQNFNYSGSCWGYNFDWQSKAFFLPENTPTIVATSFVVEALLKAYEITKKDIYYNVAVSSAEFIKKDLNRIQKPDGTYMFSYSPLDNRAVYNATLLASKTLALIYNYTKEKELKNLSFNSVKAVCNMQNEDGSFPHSDQVGQNWRDSFHTGFKLEGIQYYKIYCEDDTFDLNLKKGFDYWVKNYFDHNTGFSYYYDRGNKPTLVDLHCAGQSLSTFYNLNQFDAHKNLIEKITSWAINNMQDVEGYFYFQMKNGKLNKIQYMRWPNAWMFYGLSYFLRQSIIK